MKDESSAPLVAHCRSCGAGVAVVLAGPASACTHCGESEPLSPELAPLVARMRARLAQREARHRHLSGKLVSAATSLQWMALAAGLTMWLLFGGMVVGLALEAASAIPLADFIAGQTQPGNLQLEWWVLWSAAAGLPLSVLGFAVSLVRLRSLGLEGLPLAPAFPGAAPRCRACAGELPPGAALRRCRYCGCDNLIAGQRYRASEQALDRALDRLGAGFERSLAARIERSEVRVIQLTMVPIVLLMIVPVFGVFTPVVPELWLAPPVLSFAAVLVVVAARRLELPHVEALECLALGSQVTVDGAPMEVRAQLVLNLDARTEVLSFLGPAHAEPSLAFHLDASGPRWRVRVWAATRGGMPLDVPRDALAPAELHGPNAELEPAWVHTHGDRLRIWSATHDEPTPLWTLELNPEGPLVLDA